MRTRQLTVLVINGFAKSPREAHACFDRPNAPINVNPVGGGGGGGGGVRARGGGGSAGKGWGFDKF